MTCTCPACMAKERKQQELDNYLRQEEEWERVNEQEFSEWLDNDEKKKKEDS